MTGKAITLDELNTRDTAGFVAALGGMIENSPWIAEAAAKKRPFRTLADLHAAMLSALMAADDERKRALLNLHPDLAGKAARSGDMTADSISEQNSVGLDRLNEAEFATFHRLNTAYREKFGFPFIVCVRRHTKDSIFRQFERRVANDLATEYEAALAEVGRISALRLDLHVDAPDRLKVHGRLSTHVLDTCAGKPAADVAYELHEISATGEGRLVTRGVTNADGRTDAPVIGGKPVPIGTYELRFSIGAHFASRMSGLDEPPFLDVVPLRFSVSDPEGHYHVPLVCTPWSYSTYRGS